MCGYAVFPQHNFLDLRGVGQHSDNNIALRTDFLLGRTLGADCLQLLHSGLAVVVYHQIRIACLQQIFCHRLAHNAQTDKSDFHIKRSFIVL